MAFAGVALTPAAPAAALPPPSSRTVEPPRCEACGGDGAVPIEPIREDGGVIWSILPCEECQGTGFACVPA
ncbi:MAG TPA: hypothetical protein VHD15_06605 [Hyphomicrobiales bacterium]|nr:hypothetical protein [Hyphomicrobiales bacterium]